MPPDRTADVDALTGASEQLAARRADARERLQRARPRVFHRRERLVQRLAAERALAQAAEGLERVDDALAAACSEQRAHDQYRRDHQPDLERLATLQDRIDQRLEQLVDALVDDPPLYLEQLGKPPRDEQGRRMWRHAARLVENYRAEHHITDPRYALGAPPTESHAADGWRITNDQLCTYHNYLTTVTTMERPIEPDLGLDLGIGV